MPVLTGGQVLEREGGQVMPCEGGALLEGGLYNVGDHGLIEEAEEPVMGMGPYKYSGVPPNGYKNGIAEKGAYLVNIFTGDTYRNTGTEAATVWTADAPSGGGSGETLTLVAQESAPAAPAPGRTTIWLTAYDSDGSLRNQGNSSDEYGDGWYLRGQSIGIKDDGPNGGAGLVAYGGQAQVTTGTAAFIADGNNLRVYIQPSLGGQLLITVLPTADPHVVNAVWNDAGTLKISAGPPP